MPIITGKCLGVVGLGCERFYMALYNADSVTLTATPDEKSLFLGWREIQGDIRWYPEVQYNHYQPGSLRQRKTAGGAWNWNKRSAGTLATDQSRGFSAYFEPKYMSFLGDPGDNPYTVFRGGEATGKCTRSNLPNYWVNTANLNLVVQATDFASTGIGPAVNPDPHLQLAVQCDRPLRPGLDDTLRVLDRHVLRRGLLVNRNTGKMLYFASPGDLCGAAAVRWR